MIEFFEVLFDWHQLVTYGSDVVAYFFMATISTLLFLLRLVFAMFAGGDGDFDTGMDSGVDSDVSFTIFSLLSISAFFMGAGWMGLACRIDFDLNGLLAAFISAGFGFLMMGLASVLTFATKKLDWRSDYDVNTAIGRTGRVYLTIPEKGKGLGQVEVSISGRKKIVRAASSGPAIDAFTDVRILEARDDETLIVEPQE
ncbi:MAG: hypothetical protein KDC38_00505 [Planctomycetes bacterium]|nr:hypothetical protein [Planctomycetota bacterium]